MKHQLPHIKTKVPGPISKKLIGKSVQYEPQAITRYLVGYTPIVRKAAFGANVIDVDDNVYVDCTSSFGVSFLGYAIDENLSTIEHQIKHQIHSMGDVNPSDMRIKLSEKLASLISFISEPQVTYANSGSEAIEIAIKSAYLYTNKRGVISFHGGFHGQTLGTLSVSGHPEISNPFDQIISKQNNFVTFPTNEIQAKKSLKRIKEIIVSNADKENAIGAILFEPIQGCYGYRIPPKNFLKDIEELCRKNGVLLIADEVFTGFCRTGKLFAIEHFNVKPDIICLGKILGGGLPIGVCISSKKIFKTFESPSFLALHGSTFGGNPLACASSLSILKSIEENNITQQAETKGIFIRNKLKEKIAKHPAVKEIRGLGMLIGIEISGSDNSDLVVKNTILVVEKALSKGVILLLTGIPNCNVVGLAPPICITDEQINYVINTIEYAFTNIEPH